MITAEGILDRAKMAALIFNDTAAQGRLEAIIHPRVYELARQAELAALTQGVSSETKELVVVHDIPLLVEEHLETRFEIVVVVQASYETRIRRLIDERGLTSAQAQARIAAGATDAQRQAAGDEFLDGSGTPQQLRAQVEALWRTWQSQSGTG
jgi:dephospho-CoA kinase